VPYNISNPADVAAANRNLAFAYGWFVDPIVFGRYPQEMTDLITDGRLPTFTKDESDMLIGSYDYIGLNHYSSSYVMDNPTG
jgi:beta-glucosidase